MDDEFRPEPEERGQFGPPRRRPPTAVGVATPPPPRPPQPARYASFPSTLRRLSLALLGATLCTGGVGLVLAGSLAPLALGVGLEGAGLWTLYRAASGTRPLRRLGIALRGARRTTRRQHRRAA